MNFVKTKSKSLLMMVLSVMMVLAMMPAMASAGTQVQITSPKTAGSTIYTGESFTLTATPENSDSCVMGRTTAVRWHEN